MLIVFASHTRDVAKALNSVSKILLLIGRNSGSARASVEEPSLHHPLEAISTELPAQEIALWL